MFEAFKVSQLFYWKKKLEEKDKQLKKTEEIKVGKGGEKN